MKISLDKLEGLTHKFNIEVPVEKIKDAFENAYKDVQKQVAIKGFRKGKVPMTMIKSQYGPSVQKDVIQNLISSSYESALDEHSLDPIGYPKIHFENFEQDKPFQFSAEFEIRPEVKLNNYEGLSVEKLKVQVSAQEVESVIKRIRENKAEPTPVFEQRPAQLGDLAEISFDGFIDEQPLPGGSSESHTLELGSKNFIEGFEEGVVGLKVGESKTLNLKFPDEYHSKDIAGKPVRFEVKLLSLKYKKLPELNDEFAKSVANLETMDALKAEIEKNLSAEKNNEVVEQLKNDLLKKLVELNPVEVPKTLFERQKSALIEDVSTKMKNSGHSEEDIKDYQTKWNSDFENSAREMVQSSFLISELANKLNFKTTHEDIHKKIHELAAKTGYDEKTISEHYHKPQNLSRLEFQIMEERVITYLIDKANIKEVEELSKV